MPATHVTFNLTIDSGNHAVVSDPQGAIIAALEQVQEKLHQGMTRAIRIRDENGNSIGSFSLETK